MYWKIASLLMFALFCLWVFYESHRTVNIARKQKEAYFERERRANATRKKPLTNLEYVTVPEDLPYELHDDNDDIAAYVRTIRELSDQKIVNFTGYTNTDLKLMYGAPNITKLSIYDQNYTTLVTVLQKWADVLLSLHEEEEAYKMMEYCISIGSDVGKTYYELAEHYLDVGNDEGYFNLIETAEGLRSFNKDNIAQNLKDKLF